MFDINEKFYDSVRVYKQSQKAYDKISAICLSSKLVCPNNHRPSVAFKYGEPIKSGTITKSCYDVYKEINLVDNSVTYRPALVNLTVHYWKCKCGRRFLDPACPYIGRNKTTNEFDTFIAQQMLSHSEETNVSIAAKYDELDPTTVSKKVKNYIASLRNITFHTPLCSKIWLVSNQFAISGKRATSYLVFGELQSTNLFTLLDFLPTLDYYEVFKYLNKANTRRFNDPTIADDASEKIVIAPNTHRETIIANGYRHIDLQQSKPLGLRPPEIDRLKDVLKKFVARNISLEDIRTRLIFQSEFRRERLKQLGLGDFLNKESLGNMSYMTNIQKNDIPNHIEKNYNDLFKEYLTDVKTTQTTIDLGSLISAYMEY